MRPVAMRLMFLPVNQAWAFVFGTDLRTATIEPMGDHGRFFTTRDAAVQAATAQGLGVDSNGNVSAPA
jgi:hypothetical protein